MSDYVKNLWPKHRLNLISGASGAGKSRWILPQLYALSEGKPVFDEPTQAVKIAYVCCDRTSEDAKDTIADLGFDPGKLPIYSFMDNEMEWSFANVINLVPAGTQLTFIEAIAALVPGGNIIDYHAILRLGRQVHKTRRTSGIDFWGSTHTPKLKRGEDFKHTRDNIIGSGAWAGICGTIVHIHEAESGQREIHILPRNAEPRTLYYEFAESGHLIECNLAVGTAILDIWLKAFKPGSTITTEVVLTQAERSKVSRRTAFRWIDEKVNEGVLLKVTKGVYEVRDKM